MGPTAAKEGPTLLERMRDYETWLKDTEAELMEAIREAEDANWHHALSEEPGARHYTRLLVSI